MTNQITNPKSKYDLSERTAKFGERIISLIKGMQENVVNHTLFSQLIRSSTSIGANYMEADGAQTKKDFQHKISLCRKEAKETMHWLRMLAVADPSVMSECRKMWKEAHELVLIFSSILKSRSVSK